MKQPPIRDVLQSIRDRLDRADVQPRAEAQIGMTMFAVSELIDLVERLYERILDLERAAAERGEQ